MIEILDSLLSDERWKYYASLIEDEAKKSETTALNSIGQGVINTDAYYRSKYLREALSIPLNRLKSKSLNQDKTTL